MIHDVNGVELPESLCALLRVLATSFGTVHGKSSHR
eukprot:SAG11_NODE_14984_length_592_cov_1.135903_1_plen_35_part_01